MGLRGLAQRLADQRVVVMGDLCLDEYLIGAATRLSREAPVPVVELRQRLRVPGGAANPAHNIVALGGHAAVAGIVGADAAGAALLQQLQELGIETSGVVADPARPTTCKTRIVAQGSLRFPQHIARVDLLDRRPLDSLLQERLAAQVAQALPGATALLVSDYRNGVVTPELIARVRASAQRQGALTTVDSQGDLGQFAGFDLVRCNAAEAEAQVGFALRSDADYERALALLQQKLAPRALIVTRGGEGVSLLAQGEAPQHLPAWNREEVFDVTGAGDTVIAVLTLALAAGGSLHDAAQLAMAAAGVVVRRLGNAVVTPAELEAILQERRGGAATTHG